MERKRTLGVFFKLVYSYQVGGMESSRDVIV